jgi:putative nucleotidyltransferase with HDIG domain
MNLWTRLRDGLRAVDRPPAGGWRDDYVHHGFRALLALGIALLLPWLFARPTLPEFAGLEEGEVANRDVIAGTSYTVYKSDTQLEAERRDAEAGIYSIFARDPTAADTAIARSNALFASLDSLIRVLEGRDLADPEDQDPEARARATEAGIGDILTRAGVTFPRRDQLELLADPGQRERLRAAVESAFDELLRPGVAHSVDLQDVTSTTVVIREGDRDRFWARDSIITMDQFFTQSIERNARTRTAAGRVTYYTLLVLFSEPTLTLDRNATRDARLQARAAVDRNRTTGFVREGERIITQHEPIGRVEMEKLRAYRAHLVEEGLTDSGAARFWRDLGVVLFSGGLLGILVLAIHSFRREVYEDARSVSVIFFLIALVLVVAGIIAAAESPPALIPIAFASLLVGALFDGFLALLVVASIAGILLGQPAFEGLPVPFLMATAGAAGALAVREIRRRSQSWILIALITGGYVFAGLALLLMGHFDWRALATTSLWGFGTATACTALAMGAALPALEALTGRTTDQTLLELADMNRPLLRRLAREAPGTYAHSINVANLAEAASLTIGARARLTRVGVYYHDIGKLTRPQYFIENQPKGLNPHDRIRPSQSAEILRDHVREGLALADEAKLPGVLKDFIREHHGTQQIRYFLAKAREDEGSLDFDPNDFCYPGPKPQSKETAIVMLADAVESASRTLSDPSPERIRALIDELVNARVEEGQLDECGLTFRDLDRVKTEFAHVLTGLYHHRIDYPQVAGPALSDDASEMSDVGPVQTDVRIGEGPSTRADEGSAETEAPRQTEGRLASGSRTPSVASRPERDWGAERDSGER